MIKQEHCRDIPIDTHVTVLILAHKRLLVALGRDKILGWAGQAFHSLGSFLIVRAWIIRWLTKENSIRLTVGKHEVFLVFIIDL